MAKAATKTTSDIPVTLITTGYRTARWNSDSVHAALTNKKPFDSQDALHTAWEEALQKIKESDYAVAASENGLFSATLAEQVTQITAVDNVWCPTMGLGMVNLGSSYPRYNLDEFENNPAGLVAEGVDFDVAAWWKFVTNTGGNSFQTVFKAAAKSNDYVLVTVPGPRLRMFKADLQAAAKDLEKAELLSGFLNRLRFFGPGIEGVVPTAFLPCCMPFDRDKLDVVVPGAKSTASKRAAFLYMHAVGFKEGGTKPVRDLQAIMEAYESGLVLEFVGSSAGGEKRAKLDDDALLAEINKAADVVGRFPTRIAYYLRGNGVSVTEDRVTELMTKADKASAKTPAKPEKAKSAAAPAKRKKAA